MDQELSSPLLDDAVNALSLLPGIGRKTALRLALHILRQDTTLADTLGNSIINMRHGIRYCQKCHNISSEDICPICASALRDSRTVCVVETVKDVMLFENTRQYNGVYHVLGGIISPMDGVGPDELEIESLVSRVREGGVDEVILALGATMEGETTSFYIFRRLQGLGVRITQLARGVAMGNEIEYTDEVTLGRSLRDRTPFSDTLNIR